MEDTVIFKTTVGSCQILPDKIVFIEDEGSEVLNSFKRYRKQLLPVLLFAIIAFLFLTYKTFMEDRIIEMIFLIFMIFSIAYVLFKGLFLAYPKVIYKHMIIRIRLKKSLFHKSQHEIIYKDENGKIKYCIIPFLSGTFEEKLEKDKAIKLLNELKKEL